MLTSKNSNPKRDRVLNDFSSSKEILSLIENAACIVILQHNNHAA
jgi:hypothetical protein